MKVTYMYILIIFNFDLFTKFNFGDPRCLQYKIYSNLGLKNTK